ncbi:tripartite tricarboxylate transporter substrate binding protein [Variovorax sp. PCZ-1]|uniref:Bug family tripartite tricarboxylate transporter substrate binding protein n=1 Tax=Variovorax sp. PCZ-1 TaxID=2835533 RepID=UPI001BCE82DD|nr:tripartite tricarboxylate transporter substrate binding protein [Variovorax sp. PCZ-1]MBS7806706.1 tripartite tricarboxylate transporter substrate binding protein [Variovorax sp. PCZ-1]
MFTRLAVVAIAAALPIFSAAQNFPSQPIRLIAPFPPGGSVDITSRMIAEPLGKRLGVQVLVDNRSGASGNIGMEAVAKAKPDGYTIALNTVSLASNPSFFANMPFDTLKDFTPLGMVATSQHVLLANKNLPASNVRELIALAKSKPGKLNYASAGGGSTFHLSAELFKDLSGTFITHVPYRGGGPALQDTIAGQVEMSFPVLSAALQHARAGTVKALAVTGTKRSPLLPDVPTMAEAGLKDYAFTTWFYVFGPANMPRDVVQRINTALNEVVNSPEMRERFSREGFEAFATTPEGAGQFVAGEIKRWNTLIKAKNIKID